MATISQNSLFYLTPPRQIVFLHTTEIYVSLFVKWYVRQAIYNYPTSAFFWMNIEFCNFFTGWLEFGFFITKKLSGEFVQAFSYLPFF